MSTSVRKASGIIVTHIFRRNGKWLVEDGRRAPSLVGLMSASHSRTIDRREPIRC